ncbi:MAG: DoxX family protein [Propionicimonas sp.]|nr:DoxX family protein [Propionicimonas sp.]
MSAVVWIVTGLLAAVFLFAGVAKLSRNHAALHAGGLTFVEDFSQAAIKGIGVLEVLAAAGLILPGLTGVAPLLVPLSALGLAAVMVGAIVVHIRRNEYSKLGPILALLSLSMFVAFGRLGPVPFGS